MSKLGYIVTGTNTVNKQIANEQDRLNKFSLRKNMFNDNFYQQVYEELGRVVVSAKETGLIKQIDDTNNVYRMIIEEISKVYKDKVVREFTNPTFDGLYDDLYIDEILNQANIYSNAFNDVLLQIGYDDNTANIKLRTPDNTIVKVNGDLELEEVYIYGGVENDLQKWYGYTKDKFFYILVNDNNDVLNNDNMQLDLVVNHLGYLPFIPVHNGYRDDSFWQMYKGDDLVKSTIQVAIKMTMLNQLIKYQSFKQLIMTSEQGGIGAMDNVTLDPASILYVFGEGSEISTLDLESNYKQLHDTTKEIIVSIATNYKLSPASFRLTSVPSSGFSLQMENLKLDNFVTKQQNYFKNIEHKLFKMLSDITGQGGEMTVDFVPPTYPKSKSDILDEHAKEIELGLNSSVSILEKTGLTEEEATKEFMHNLQVRNEATDKINKPTIKPINIEVNNGN